MENIFGFQSSDSIVVSYIMPVVRVPMMTVVRMNNLLFRPRVPTVVLRWRAIISQMERMAMVGMMKARLAAVHTQ